jgi:NADH-quinone oxidoreductase subunit A
MTLRQGLFTRAALPYHVGLEEIAAMGFASLSSMMSSSLAATMADPRSSWAPIVLMIVIGVGFAAGNVILSLLIGPRRTGPGKEATYESGMMPIGDTRKRFNVRFYIVAMIFLVIDVDIIFFYPWATIFPHYIQNPPSPGVPQLLLIEILIFVAILLVAYIYAWGKGVFRWD